MGSDLAVRDAQEAVRSAEMMLSVRHGGVTEAPSVAQALATISAGRKIKTNSGKEAPTKSKNGEWYIHNQDGLGDNLIDFFGAVPVGAEYPHVYRVDPKEGRTTPLLVAFPSNEPSQVFRQYFAKRTAKTLEMFGDAEKITHFIVKNAQAREFETRVYMAGTPEYREAVAQCKVECSAYFALADWGYSEAAQTYDPDTIYPDGLGIYRLRFTSVNAAKNFVETLRKIAITTGGRLAGVPLELFLQHRVLTQPGGFQGPEWIWTLRFKPPGKALRLSLSTIRQLASKGAEAGGVMALPAPQEDMAALEAELTEVEVENLQTGFNPQVILDEYFARVQDTPYAGDEGRAWLVARISGLADQSITSLTALIEAHPDFAWWDRALLEVESAVALFKGLHERISSGIEQIAKLYKTTSEKTWAKFVEQTGYGKDMFELDLLLSILTDLEAKIAAKQPHDDAAVEKLI